VKWSDSSKLAVISADTSRCCPWSSVPLSPEWAARGARASHRRDPSPMRSPEGLPSGPARSLRRPPVDPVPLAEELVCRVLVGGSVPELHHLAITQVEDMNIFDFDAPTTPAAAADQQRHAVLIVG
jgi:hypothetical protein